MDKHFLVGVAMATLLAVYPDLMIDGLNHFSVVSRGHLLLINAWNLFRIS